MARMMPAFCPAECPSPAEPEIFAALRDAPGTGDWIVLHSLDIAQHVKQVSGEADFVVIVPDMGVLCLEVKGATTITRTADGCVFRSKPITHSAGSRSVIPLQADH